MSNTIKAIEQSTVHRICSGQVVLSLAIAVKELTENAIDAGATSVEVKLKEYGSELIEVSDNGCGVHPENFEGLTLKHHTSKLRDFADLTGVHTFGFRGEALSSLCALSDLTVSTRHTSQVCGSILVFDNNGRITSNTPFARQIGTTVSLMNIFYTLPVRHKEFHRNLKKEFNKMLQLLYGYCLVATGVRISCSNQSKKGSKSVVVATQGIGSVKENISSVFGSKQLTSLLELKESRPSPELLEELKLPKEACSMFKLSGWVSSCAHGSGRAAPDRQFYFINSRPCDPSKVSKAVNEVYHSYNLHQYPFVFLNIQVEKDSVDVNVTPDKRQIFLENEKLLIAMIKASLNETFRTVPSTFVLNNVITKAGGPAVKAESLKPNLSIFTQWRSKNDTNKRTLENSETKSSTKVIRLDNRCVAQQRQRFVSLTPIVNSAKVPPSNVSDEETLLMDCRNDTVRIPEFPEDSKNDLEDDSGTSLSPSVVVQTDSLVNFQKPENSSSQVLGSIDSLDIALLPSLASSDLAQSSSSDSNVGLNTSKTVIYDTYIERAKKYVVVPFDVSFIKCACESRAERDNSIDRIRFRAAIDPSKNDQAESELQREISKERFSQMEIIGQFNLGFIIAKLDKDLFIIDQHASDEKFNFETLQKNTIIRNQKLVVPQALELTAANETILIDNVEIFKKNGFEFKIDLEALPTQKISLTAVPLSLNRVFGKDDVDELLFMLQDVNGQDLSCRPSGIRTMFASRACRKSVMIGTALDSTQMKKLVTQMGTIEHPWNCPHGRPTMRHLVNIELVKKI